MSNNITYVSEVDFDSKILNYAQLTLVDFYADWCMPCKMLGPILEKVADNNVGSIQVAKLNVDDARNTALKFRVTGVPAMLFFKDGQEVERMVGLHSEEEIQEVIERLK